MPITVAVQGLVARAGLPEFQSDDPSGDLGTRCRI
jgi:hypothetical protein